jgi:hypothetical protein
MDKNGDEDYDEMLNIFSFSFFALDDGMKMARIQMGESANMGLCLVLKRQRKDHHNHF